MSTSVREWLAQSKKRGMDLGIERVFRVHQVLVQSAYNPSIVHVAGSNGKGTLCATLAAHLHKLHQSTVLFTSPHLVQIEERIRLDGRPISTQQFDAYLLDIMEIESSINEQLTFFEITFLVACLCATRNDVDVFIVETGLGGRYDATRILPADVGVVTSLSLEHRDILGDTLAEIAAEKAAIARPDKPLIVRSIDDSAAKEAIEYEARHAGRSELGEAYGAASVEWISIPEEASFDEEAALLAQATLQRLNVDAEGLQISQALLNWPGRFHEIPAPWDGSILFDAAHNPSGLQRMLPQLQARIEQESSWTLVFGCTPQHDLTSFASPLIELCHQHPPESIVLTKPQLGRYPGVELEALRSLNWPTSCTILEQEDAAATSDRLDKIQPAFTLVIGSLYLVGEMYNALGYWGTEHMELFPAKTQRDEA